MLDGKIETVKIAASGTIAALISASGAKYEYVTVLIILMGADTALGWLKGRKNHSWKSAIAKWGFAGKIVELGLVYLLVRLDWAFNTDGFLANIGVFYYGIVELASIVENINDGGLATLPPGLVDIVRKLKYSAGKIVMEKIKKIIASTIGIDLDAVKDNENGDNDK